MGCKIMVADGDKIPESIAIKLFDQVKNSSDQNTEAIKDLTRVVGDLTKCIEKQPDLNDMASVCVTRGYDCAEMKKNIACIGKTTKSIKARVTTMIAVVLITFSLMTISYFFVRSTVENMTRQMITEEIHKIQDVEGD